MDAFEVSTMAKYGSLVQTPVLDTSHFFQFINDVKLPQDDRPSCLEIFPSNGALLCGTHRGSIYAIKTPLSNTASGFIFHYLAHSAKVTRVGCVLARRIPSVLFKDHRRLSRSDGRQLLRRRSLDALGYADQTRVGRRRLDTSGASK